MEAWCGATPARSIRARVTDSGTGVVDSGMGGADSGTGVGDSGVSVVDAGPPPCRGWGQRCAGADCCPYSDAGVLQACSRNNLCQEYAADCKESGFSCEGDQECCGEKCMGGRCAICQPQDGPCTKATDCCPGYTCAADQHCTYAATRVPDGARCQNTGQCTNGFCDPTDAGPHDGLCKTAVGCGALNSTDITNCCPGLVGDGGSTCCQPDKDWCEYNSDCCSGTCLGRRCTRATTGYIGDRCWSAPECAGLLPICDSVGLTCTDRLCLPQGLNLFSGCCRLDYGKSCRFDDGSVCSTSGAMTAQANTCCSGVLNNGKCTDVTLY